MHIKKCGSGEKNRVVSTTELKIAPDRPREQLYRSLSALNHSIVLQRSDSALKLVRSLFSFEVAKCWCKLWKASARSLTSIYKVSCCVGIRAISPRHSRACVITFWAPRSEISRSPLRNASHDARRLARLAAKFMQILCNLFLKLAFFRICSMLTTTLLCLYYRNFPVCVGVTATELVTSGSPTAHLPVELAL